MMRDTLLVAAGALAGWLFGRWDERHPLTWGGRFEWAYRLRCRWLGIHEPWAREWIDCVHCRYAGPLVQEQARRREAMLRWLREAQPVSTTPAPAVEP